MKKIIFLVFIKLVIVNIAIAQPGCPPNIGFEDSTSAGWVCKYGSYGSGPCPPIGNCPAFLFNLNQIGCLDSAGIDCPLYSHDRHCILDKQCSGSCRDSNFIPTVDPLIAGNQFSFRLGNAIAGGTNTNPNYAQAEAIRYTFLVSPQNAGLTYYYAVFLQDTFHEPESGPRFEVAVYDSANNPLPCGNYLVVGGTTNQYCGAGANFHRSNGWAYSDWTPVAMDLTSYIGQTVSIEFRTADCYEKDMRTCNYHPGTHSAYAYIDLECKPSLLLGYDPFAIVNCSGSDTICAPVGYKSYLWSPSNQTTECITVNNPVSGSVYTIYLTSVTGCTSGVNITLKCLVGINVLLNDNAISVFPNPANDKINLKFSQNTDRYTLSIFNQLGVNVLNKKIDYNSETTIDISQFPEGLYLLRLTGQDASASYGKLIMIGD